jgi:hypothetical protein
MRRLCFHRRLFRKLRRNDGQAALELVLVLPIFFLFVLLLVDLGVMMYEYVSVSNAVREGARYAAVNCGDGDCSAGGDDPVDRTVERSSGFLIAGEVKVSWPDGIIRGAPAEVCARHTYDFLFFPALSIDVRSSSEMRLEQKDKGSGTTIGTVTC